MSGTLPPLPDFVSRVDENNSDNGNKSNGNNAQEEKIQKLFDGQISFLSDDGEGEEEFTEFASGTLSLNPDSPVSSNFATKSILSDKTQPSMRELVSQERDFQTRLKDAAALKIQSNWRSYSAKKELIALRKEQTDSFKGHVEEQKDVLFKRLFGLQNRIEQMRSKQVITHESYDSLMLAAKVIGENYSHFTTNADYHLYIDHEIKDAREFTNKFNEMIHEIQEGIEDLQSSLSYASINEAVELALGEESLEISKKSSEFIAAHEQMFQATDYVTLTVEKQDSGFYELSNGEDTWTEYSDQIVGGSSYFSNSDVLESTGYYEKIHGAELRIPLLDAEGNVEKLICVKGNFAEDPLNFLFLHGEVKEKKDAFQHLLLQNSRFSRQFTVDYIKQLPIKTFFTTSREEFLDQVDQDFTDFQQLNQKTLQVLIEKFSTSEFEEQMRTLSLLLLEGNGTKGYFMFSQTCDSFPGFREITQRCLHHSLWTKLEGMETRISALKDNIDELRNNSVPLDEQILAAEMPEDAKCKALDRLKLAQGHPLMGGGDSKAKEWIELLLKMPWGKVVPTGIDMKNSTSSERSEYLKNFRGKLDEAVYGQNEAKDIFEDIVAEWIGSGKETGDVIVIQGPAGNGKTTLVKEGLAKALGRPFVFVPLGGATDSSYLVGHDFTYHGAQPGILASKLQEAKCINPVILIDEVDKISQSEKGQDIFSTLTHVLDPAQNSEFFDKFFAGIPVDLSKALFVLTCNRPWKIDSILQDRMHFIYTDALTPLEKLHVANLHFLPKLTKDVGMSTEQVQFSDDVISFIIDNYTVEAGVRKLKEKLKLLLRRINKERIQNPDTFPTPFVVSKDIVIEHLGEPMMDFQRIAESPQVGTVNGMYATEMGTGGLTVIHATEIPSKEALSITCTGQLGEVMKESVTCARSVLLNVLPDDVKQKLQDKPFGLHLHAEEASVKKEGPSAGGAITLCLISQILGVPIRNDLSLTGEINPKGMIKKIGGLPAKLRGAKRAGVTHALVPRANEKDYLKILEKDPTLIDKDFRVTIVDTIHDVLENALMPGHGFKFKRNDGSLPTIMEEREEDLLELDSSAK
jgi:endopeptidase La